jgi:hypothetical protein
MSKEKCNCENCNCELLDYTKTDYFKSLSKLGKLWVRIKIALIEVIAYF